MKTKVALDPNLLVKADNVSMFFRKSKLRYDTLKEQFVGLFSKKNKHENINVLDNISFEIKRGESLGVIGHNGAGKSTLLRLVAGIYKPTSGSIQTNGKVVLLNLGSGFDLEASAEENILINGALLGYSHKEMKRRMDSIFDFAELQDFRKMPIKNFSTGMISRLGFSIAIDIKPDLILVDEVLSVGDKNFQQKCMNKILELKKQNVSFFYVSHNINSVRSICNKTLWIEKSKVMGYGDSKIICDNYSKYCNDIAKK